MIVNTEERAYLDLITDVARNGYQQIDRTGVGTRQKFRRTLRFDLSDGRIPIFTTKFVSWKTAFREMLWFLSGSSSIEPLLRQNIHIWTDWPHAKYVKATGDQISLRDFERRILDDPEFSAKWADSGRAYGVQWRHWRQFEPVKGLQDNGKPVWKEVPGGIDQVSKVIETLRTNPHSRRIILEGWNVAEVEDMMLPPCHKTYQFEVEGDRLNLAVNIRSWDLFLGAAFFSAMLLRMMAMHTGLKPGELVMDAICAHVYLNHMEQVEEQGARIPTLFPFLEIKPRDSFFDHQIEDFVVTGYEPQAAIKGEVAV